jgi:hypothetical protein
VCFDISFCFRRYALHSRLSLFVLDLFLLSCRAAIYSRRRRARRRAPQNLFSKIYLSLRTILVLPHRRLRTPDLDDFLLFSRFHPTFRVLDSLKYLCVLFTSFCYKNPRVWPRQRRGNRGPFPFFSCVRQPWPTFSSSLRTFSSRLVSPDR